MSFQETLPYIMVTLAAIIVVVFTLLVLMRRKRENQRPLDVMQFEVKEKFPFKVSRSVSVEEASKAKEKLRMLELEREILSDAIRRLYEAHAEGKITEEERERLAQRYKGRMMKIKNAIAESESIVALHELEAMQEDLVKLFNERFDELNTKIEELRSRLEIKQVKEAPTIVPISTPSPAKPTETAPKKRKKRAKKPPAQVSPKTEAEKRIEEIRAEVEKVLERLGQMEIEA
ncbi:MAG: hypothetical protein QXE76_00805 [Candidatus Bathyarchaeia archaeon]